MVWRIDDPMGHELQKIFHLIVPYTKGVGIDVGAGKERVYPHFITVDSGKDHGGKQVSDIKARGDALPMFADGGLDFVVSSHLLEHIVDFKAALREWWRVVKVGGSLVLYLPHKQFYPNVGQHGANPDHKHDFTPQDIIDAMREIAPSWRLVESEERNERQEYSFFQVFNKTDDGQQVEEPWRKAEKSCLVIRYGAFGDQIQTSSVLPGLKRQGYHITYQTTPRGFDVIGSDRNVDAFWIQGENQVPNEMLGPYWEALRIEGRFDRIINLCESVEGALLKLPSRFDYHHSDAVRRQTCGTVNYLARMHDLAGVPHDYAPAFYAKPEEIAAARAERDRMGPLCVLWIPTGSSHHKAWPHLDVGVTWLLKHTPAHVVICGDAGGVLFEGHAGDAAEKNGADMSRLHFRSGKWSIRETLTFAHMATVVVGPETGVLNAVSMHPKVGKVVMLSHSSAENLTRDWKNTITIEPPASVSCYPCHRLHFTTEFCPEDEATGAARCAVAIEPKTVFEAIMQAAGIEKKLAAE